MSIIFPTYSEKKALSKSKQKKFCIWQIVTNCERKRMRKLALSDEILLSVDKAARYIGGEINSVMKNLDGIDVRVAFCFPDVCEMLFPSKRIYII